MGYILLYSIQLFTVTDKTLQEWNINPRDFQVIKMAQRNLATLYTRFLKEKIGFERAADYFYHQKYFMEKIHEIMLIVTMENLHLNELSNSTYLNPLSEEKRLVRMAGQSQMHNI